MYNYNGLKPSDSLLNIFTTSFVAWYNASLPFFNVGANSFSGPSGIPKGYLEAVQEEKATVAFLVPTM